MAKLNRDTRSAKVKRVAFANMKTTRASSPNGRSFAKPRESEQRAPSTNANGGHSTSTNARRDSSTTSSEQFTAHAPYEEGIVAGIVANDEAQVKHDRDAANFQLAIYIAMAQAGLALTIAICYGVGQSLKGYWTPIHWAILISMPLQRLQGAVVKFWKRHLQSGLVETIFAIPAAILWALLETVQEIREELRFLLVRDGATRTGDSVTFSNLCQWLLFLGTCTLLYEYLGLVHTTAVACVACAICWSLNGILPAVTAAFPDWAHQEQERRGSAATLLHFTVHPVLSATRWSNRGVAEMLIRDLPFLVALGLIVSMVLLVVGGTILFSFKVGVEAKDAVVAFKINMENIHSGAGIGFSNWLETNLTSQYIDSHMMVVYDTVVQKVDEYVERNNMTTVANAAKEFLNAIAYNMTSASDGHSMTTNKISLWDSFMMNCHLLKEKFERRELNHAMKSLVKSGGSFMTGSFYVLVVLGANVANFIKQMIIFVFVLFFLITSESGGVMEQALEMVPLSEVTRQKCASVLDRTISAVLLTTGKLMLFQGLFTYLFFRLLKIHFLYMATSIALVQGLMPIFPNWIASLPALLQLLAERKYVGGLSTIVFYKSMMDYGILKIQGVVSNYNQYLTGLSIAGGMALFQPAICGVIMGPLILTVLIAIRDLYSEFVLKVVTNYQGI